MTILTIDGFGDRGSRRLLIASLVLNLFFIGAIGTLAVRSYVQQPPAATERPRTAAARIERVAAALPAADAETLRAAFRAREAAVEADRSAVTRAFDAIRDLLRAESFDVSRLRAAMGESRNARLAYEQALQEVFAVAAAGMTVEGRRALADWRSRASTR